MLTLSAGNSSALSQRKLVARDFLWIVARDRTTLAPWPVGFWSDVGNVNAQVLDPDNGVENRDFYGASTLISISDIPRVSNVTVQEVTIRMSHLNEIVEQAIRLYDCKLAKVQIYRGLYDYDTRAMVAPAYSRFIGIVDKIEIHTPEEGGEAYTTLSCKSQTQEMTRSNPDTRSDASQKKRSATDNFYADVGVVGEWEFFWGKANGKVDTAKAVPATQQGAYVGAAR